MGETKTGSQIAKEIGMAVWACHRTLRDLVSLGVLDLVNSGKSHLYRMNRESCLAREILIPLFQREASLFEQFLKKGLEPVKSHILSATLFGNTVQEKASPLSNIDLLLIVSSNREKKVLKDHLNSCRLDLLLEFPGALITPLILTQTELTQREVRQDPLYIKIKSEGRLLFGQVIERLVHAAA